jgi:hypothetical protein
MRNFGAANLRADTIHCIVYLSVGNGQHPGRAARDDINTRPSRLAASLEGTT